MIVLLIISVIVAASYCLLMVRFNKAWNKIPEFNSTTVEPFIQVTVIVPVRNESENINAVLHSLMKQSYPKHLLEIIISDDHSEDDTAKIAKEFFQNYTMVDGCVLDNSKVKVGSKKHALKSAIELSKGELIITTDADCVHNKDWILEMVSFFTIHKPVMICGPVLMAGDSSFIQQFQTTDYLSLQACGAASLFLERPLLCSGANLLFTKRAFYEVGGYDNNLGNASGDDTFLMLKMYDRFRGKVQFLKSVNSIVTTTCASTIGDFVAQRFRWISKISYYSNSFIKGFGYYIVFVNLWLVILLFAGFNSPIAWLVFFSILFTKTFVDYALLSNAAKFFNLKMEKSTFFCMEVVYPCYLLRLLFGFLRGTFSWKHRLHNN